MPRVHLIGAALESMCAQVRASEGMARQSICARSDDHLVRLGQHLQTCGKVWRVTDHCVHSNAAFASRIARHHQAGGDTDLDPQRDVWRGSQCTHPRDQLKTRAH